MSGKEAVTVNVLDREYRIACEADERRQLLDAADFLDQQMRAIRDGGSIVGLEKVAVLAGLNIANDLLKTQVREATLSGTVADRVLAIRGKLDAQSLD